MMLADSGGSCARYCPSSPPLHPFPSRPLRLLQIGNHKEICCLSRLFQLATSTWEHPKADKDQVAGASAMWDETTRLLPPSSFSFLKYRSLFRESGRTNTRRDLGMVCAVPPFTRDWDIRHTLTMPFLPATGGAADRRVRNFTMAWTY